TSLPHLGDGREAVTSRPAPRPLDGRGVQALAQQCDAPPGRGGPGRWGVSPSTTVSSQRSNPMKNVLIGVTVAALGLGVVERTEAARRGGYRGRVGRARGGRVAGYGRGRARGYAPRRTAGARYGWARGYAPRRAARARYAHPFRYGYYYRGGQ